MSRGRRSAMLAVGAVVAVCLPFWLSPVWLTTMIFVLIASVGVSGLNVLTGFAGQISLGHAFFMAVGAYAYVLVEQAMGQPLPALLVAAIVAAFAGVVVGPLALRVSGFYLAVVTLGLVFIGQHVLFNAEDISGGPAGRDFPSLQVGGIDLGQDTLAIGAMSVDPNGLHYYLFLAIFVATTGFCWRLARSRSGRAMFAVRERPEVAESVGVDLARTKIGAFAVSAFFGGLGGGMLVAYVGYAEPGHWDLHLSVQYVAALIVGGMGTVAGPVLGAIVVFGLPTLLSRLAEMSGTAAPTGAMTSALYGALIVLFLTCEPHGVVGLGHRIAAAKRRFFDHAAPRSSDIRQEPVLTTHSEEMS